MALSRDYTPFIEAARKQGFSDDEIKAKIYKEEGISVAPKKDDRNFFVKATDFLAPATANIARDISGARAVNSKEFKAANEQIQASQQQAQTLIAKAKNETDPVKKQKLLQLARDLNNNTQGVDTSSWFSEDVGKNALRRGIASGVELGSLFTPGPKGTTAGKRILSAGLTGAGVAGSRELTNLEGVDENLLSGLNADKAVNTAKSAGLGFVAGAGLQVGVEGTSWAGKQLQKGVEKLKKAGYDAYASTFKENKAALELIKRRYGNNPEEVSKKFIANKIPNTKSGTVKELNKMNDQYDREIINKLKLEGNKSGKTIDFQKIIDDVRGDIERTYRLPKDKAIKDAALAHLEESTAILEKKMFPESANRLRIEYDHTFTPKPYWELTPSDLVDKMISNETRHAVQDAVGATKPFFRRYSMLKDAEMLFYKEPKWGFNELLGWVAAQNPAGAFAARAMKSPGALRSISTGITKLPLIRPGQANLPPVVRNVGVAGLDRLNALQRARNQ